MQSLPDKGRKVSETVERLKKLIAQREKIEDTVVQFERLTVSQLVQRTQLDALDSDDSDNNDDDKMHIHSCTEHPALSEQHKEITSGRQRETTDSNKSRNKQFSSQSSDRTWDYESSATPPSYKLEVISRVLILCPMQTPPLWCHKLSNGRNSLSRKRGSQWPFWGLVSKSKSEASKDDFRPRHR